MRDHVGGTLFSNDSIMYTFNETHFFIEINPASTCIAMRLRVICFIKVKLGGIYIPQMHMPSFALVKYVVDSPIH